MEDPDTERSEYKINAELQTQISRNASSSPGSIHSNTSISSDTALNDGKTQEKVCVVCGDTATGTHFAAMTCEGCKGFFRRSMKKCSQFTCAFENHCAINKSNRKHCQACRLQKCLSVGMNSNLIMSDESVSKKRELIRANREKKEFLRRKKEEETERDNSSSSSSASPNPQIQMMAEDKDLIQMMLESHNSSYDFNYEGYESFRGRQHVKSPNRDEVERTHTTLAWLIAGKNEKDLPPPERKNNEKSSIKKYENDALLSKKIKPELPYPDEGIPNTVTGDMIDMFSTLHGVSQPVNSVNRGSGIRSSSQGHDSYYSDASGSTSSTSTSQSPAYLPQKPGDFMMQDPFSPFDQATGGMPMFGDADDPSSIGAGFDSMSYLQGLFMNQGSTEGKPHSLFLHFCDIMAWGIKKVIEFCKCIPEFQELSTVDQINLLRGGCLEMLVLRSYFAFASDGNKYMSEKFQYSPTDFLQAGASSEFIEQYSKVHMRMRKMQLKVEEICLLIGLVLFSPDRPGIEDCEKVEHMQKRIAQALRAYEYTHKDPDKACIVYSELLLLLPVLRTINVLFSNTILTLKEGSNEDDINPLILEVNN